MNKMQNRVLKAIGWCSFGLGRSGWNIIIDRGVQRFLGMSSACLCRRHVCVPGNRAVNKEW